MGHSAPVRSALLAALALAVSVVVLGSSGGCTTSGSDCRDDGTCDSGQACITGGVCAVLCNRDGGAPCTGSETCQGAALYCKPGTLCPDIAVQVCR